MPDKRFSIDLFTYNYVPTFISSYTANTYWSIRGKSVCPSFAGALKRANMFSVKKTEVTTLAEFFEKLTKIKIYPKPGPPRKWEGV